MKLKTLKKLTIYRDLWARGYHIGGATARLLNGRGMCCLGFACHAAGVSMVDLYQKAQPKGLVEPVPLLSKVVEYVNDHEETEDTRLSDRAMAINDDSKLTEVEREAQLTALFAPEGVVVTFRDKAPKGLRAGWELTVG